MKRQAITPDTSYTFADYFKLNADVEDVLAYFGYTYVKERLVLPRTGRALENLDELLARLEEGMQRVNLSSETARREVLIAPILLQAAHYTDRKIKIEYWLDVSHQLKGALDYLLSAPHNLLVVEAKNADLTRGFTQLAVELIALDRLEETALPAQLYGAVTTGDIWRFGVLDRPGKVITDDIDSLAVPSDTAKLLEILVGLLE